MALSEKGVINIEDPIQNYVTKWKLPQTKFNNNEVLISRVMSHTSGLNMRSYPGYDPSTETLPKLEDSLSGKFGSFTGWLFNPTGLKIIAKPGSEYSYSGGGYSLLQLMMEECTQNGYLEYMNSYVLKPLNMSSSSFEYNSTIKNNLAKPYSSSGKVRPNYLFTEKAAAGLYTTAIDLSQILNEAYRLNNLPEYKGLVITADSLNRIIKPRIINSTISNNGLGYFLKTTTNGNTIIFHNGGNRGWNCFYAVELATGRGIVVLTNSDAGIDVVHEIENKYYNILNKKNEEKTSNN